MKRPTFLRAAATGLAVSLAAGALFAALEPAVGAATALRLVIPLAALAWLACLLAGGRGAPGRVTAFAAWCAVAIALWVFAPPLGVYLLAHVAALSLIRALYLHAGALPALMDLCLGALGYAAAAWALSRSGSVFLAAWTFFLVQALVAFVPRTVRTARAGGGVATADDAAFERARRRAEAALRQLVS